MVKKILQTIGNGFKELFFLLIESTQHDTRRRYLQYFLYILIVIAMNFIVGKNISNTRYPWYSNVSIFLLVNINIVLMVVLILVIFRSLTKLLQDSHSNIFGSRLKVKLVIFSVAITVVPVGVIFFFASTIINDSINRWFDSQVSNAFASTTALMEQYENNNGRELYNHIKVVSSVISDRVLYNRSQHTELKKIFGSYIKNDALQGLAFFNVTGDILVINNAFENNNLEKVYNSYSNEIIHTDRHFGYSSSGNFEKNKNNSFFWTGVPVYKRSTDQVIGMLVAYKVAPKNIAEALEAIQDSRDIYYESRFFSFPVKKSYFMLLVLMSLLVIFAGIWGSLIFARGITKPIEALADASVEISKGNLDVSIVEQGTDEIGYLIKTFNRMSKQLSLHTKELNNKNEMLSEMFAQISKDKMYIDAIFKNVDSALILFNNNLEELKVNAIAENIFIQHRKGFEDIILSSIKDFAQSKELELFKEVEITLNDDKRIFSVTITKITSSDEQQMLLVLDDITEIVNAQRVSVWKEVATRIAHEIKNPLTPIKLVAERVKKRSSNLQDTSLKLVINESMDTVITETENLLQLVEEFNMFARLPKPKKFPIELKSLFDETLLLYRGTYPDVLFKVNIEEGLLLNADRYQLKRVLQNLISNAIFAVKKDGRIDISAINYENNMLEVTVADNGCGIMQEDIANIFEPYFSNRSGGTGLGLAIVKKIIEEHSGKIHVESSPNGTKFTMLFPTVLEA